MAKHLDVAAYWNDIAPRLDAYLGEKRDRRVEEVVVHSFALYSFVQETFSAEATKNKNVLQNTSIMLVHVHDVMRGLVSAQAELSPVTIAALLRVALEVRCNQLFIIKSPDPEKYADRFRRYEGIERLLREEYAPPGTPRLLSQAGEAEIRVTCPEWFNSKGKVVVKHWTAEDDYKSLKSLAGAVGLEDDYAQVYSLGSKFVHGSSLLRNLYTKGRGMGALANPELCSQLSMLASGQCLYMLREAASFFGVPSFDDDYLAWQMKWMECFRSLQQP